jgi:peptidoglycan/LPS O-acetylase OafA/YrhL
LFGKAVLEHGDVLLATFVPDDSTPGNADGSPSTKLQSGMAAPANTFNALRLSAATLVIYAHAYPLSGRGFDPLSAVAGGVTAGAVAVFMFFAMSGWLVTASFAADPHVGRFLARRMLRIFPAFAVVILAMALALGPAVTTLPLRAYLADPLTHSYLNGVLIFPVQHVLPGVFADNPFKGSVNGSLWTLGPELLCYLGVAALGACALLRGPAVACALTLCVASFYALASAEGTPSLLFMNVRLMLELMVYFLSGSLLWLARERIRFSLLALPLLAVLLWAFGSRGYGQAILFLLLPYATLSLAQVDTGTAPFFDRIGDWSYGTYLWAFPIQQVLMAIEPRMGLASFVALAVALSWIAGALSWHLIEKRALALKPVARPARVRTPVEVSALEIDEDAARAR